MLQAGYKASGSADFCIIMAIFLYWLNFLMACDLYGVHTRPVLIQLISLHLCDLSYPEFDVSLCFFCSDAFRATSL